MEADYQIVCPFLTDDPAFAHGVEFGMLFARMQRRRAVDDVFTTENQDRILLLASRLGWRVRRVEAIDAHWFRVRMVKGPPPAEAAGGGG